MLNIRKFFSRMRDYSERLAVSLPFHITNANLKSTLFWTEVAQSRFVNNADRREFVVARLMEKGFPESKARLAVELAIFLIKRGQD